MTRRRFIAFWDTIILSQITAILFSIAIYIIVVIKGEKPWYSFSWFYTLLAAFCIAIPSGLIFAMHRVTIDLNCDKVDFFYLVNYAKNDKDINSNWFVYPSEIKTISVVKLTKNEKRKYTSARFIFSKYLKVEMKYGHVKYIYVSHYSNKQINKIIKMLTKNISQSKNILS